MLKRHFVLAFIMAVLAALWLASSSGCTANPTQKLQVVTGTSLIAGIVKDIAGEKVSVHNIIPPGLCPGQYDVKPGDIEALAKSKVLIIHNYQKGHADIKKAIAACENPSFVVKVIDIQGNWMAPPVQAEAICKVGAVLSEMDPVNSAYYAEKADQRQRAVLAKGEEIKKRLSDAKVSGVKAICNNQQEGFVRWAGFDVVAIYGRPEEFTPASVADITAKAKAANVAMVIDNLQSSPNAGKGIAQDIGAVEATISNFPGALEGTDTWEKALNRNLDLLLNALAEYRKSAGGK